MQPSTLLAVAATCLGLASTAALPESPAVIASETESNYSPIEKRACFQSGETFGNDRNTALSRARDVCNGIFSGTYRRGMGYTACRNISGSKHVVLTVRLSGPNAPIYKDLGSAECYSGLSSEIESCSRGGQTTYGNWYYRADPNSGTCG